MPFCCSSACCAATAQQQHSGADGTSAAFVDARRCGLHMALPLSPTRTLAAFQRKVCGCVSTNHVHLLQACQGGTLRRSCRLAGCVFELTLSMVSSAPPPLLRGLSLNARSSTAACRLPCCRTLLVRGWWCRCDSVWLLQCMVAVGTVGENTLLCSSNWLC